MTSIGFDELIARLPASTRLPLAQSARPAVEAPGHEDFFVAPTLINVWPPEGRTSVVLVSARGAVGKTTLARELAWRAGGHLWSLAKFQVGHQFLEGALTKAYGDEAYSQVARELREGKRLVVLDGLDEARLHAGERNFDAFLDSLAERFREAGHRPSLVMLGRPLSADDTAERLLDAGVPFEWYEISYFDRGAAEGFIENYLERGRHKPHRNRPEEFQRARKTVLDWLERSVPEGVDAKSLVGYAPVLVFIAGLLDVGNPFGQVQELEREASQERPGALLGKIAEGLLRRETEKVVKETSKDELRREFVEANAWAPEEQRVRFLARKTSYELQSRPPAALPEPLRREYEERVKVWLGEHPFNDQPLFEDYIYAWLLSGGEVENDLREAVREYLRSERVGYRPTPLLLWFVAQAGDPGRTGEEVSVSAADFGFVYESVLADAAPAVLLRGRPPEARLPKLTLASSEAGQALLGEIRFPSPEGADEKTGGRKVRLQLRESGRPLWFWRHLVCADIAVAGAVRIGAKAADFFLGPDVDLECGGFACDAGTVRVTARGEKEAVVLSAQRYLGDATPELSSWGENQFHLRVDWKPLLYPWNRYAASGPQDPRLTTEMREAFLKLRRVLMPFRARGYEDVARAVDLIENPAVAGRGLARQLLAFCRERKLVLREGGFYVLSRQELNNRGIYWENLRGRQLSPPIASFLAEFLDWPGR